jgi:exopolyphosphatase/guanosine-5'-triphosphate,3'-diphosphate pyrophosphatase
VRVAVFDVGTNTTRLLVAEGDAGGFAGEGQSGPGGRDGAAPVKEIDRRLIFTRLGQGVDASRRLRPEAIARTVAALEELRGVAAGLGAERFRLGATSAVRDAANREEFVEAARAAIAVEPEVLSGEAEARLSYLGATADLPAGTASAHGGRCLVTDIGGGSTEFVAGSGASVEARISLDVGSVRLTERHLASDPPAAGELRALEDDVDAALGAVAEAIPDAGDSRFVGVAGTVTTLAALVQGLEHYDSSRVHHFRLTVDDVEAQYRRLAALPVAERVKIPCLPPSRADVIVAGTAILRRSMAFWSFEDLVVSERDILDGLAQELLAQGSGSGNRSGLLQ